MDTEQSRGMYKGQVIDFEVVKYTPDDLTIKMGQLNSFKNISLMPKEAYMREIVELCIADRNLSISANPADVNSLYTSILEIHPVLEFERREYFFNRKYRRDDIETDFDIGQRTSRSPLEETVNRLSHSFVEDIDWWKPKEIVQYADRYVIGQSEAKKVIATSISNLMVRRDTKNEIIPINHCLLIGNTGVGKTYLVQTLAKKAGIPYVYTSIADKSSSGLVGENASSIFQYLFDQVGPRDEAPYAIVFFDEIDKLAGAKSDPSSMEARLQSSLVSWLQDANVGVEEFNAGVRSKHVINTRNILFMAAGAFSGYNGHDDSLLSIISKRNKGESTIGFGSEPRSKKISDPEMRKMLHRVTSEDISSYGLKPELVGRLHSFAVFDDLDMEMKRKILRESEDSPLRRYEFLLSVRGFNVNIDDATIDQIALMSPKDTGVRGLNDSVSRVFNEILFDPTVYAGEGDMITIDGDLVRPILESR